MAFKKPVLPISSLNKVQVVEDFSSEQLLDLKHVYPQSSVIFTFRAEQFMVQQNHLVLYQQEQCSTSTSTKS